MSASPPSRMPSASAATDAPPERPERPERPGDRWRPVGLALIGVWSTCFVVAVALWLDVAFLSGEGTADVGLVRFVGAPFVLVALGLLWWAWRSVQDLRQGRREGWTLLLVLGGVAVAQTVMTAPAVVGALGGPGTPGTAEPSGPPRELITGMLAAIALGLASVVVAVLGRRSWATADPARSADATPSADPAASTSDLSGGD